MIDFYELQNLCTDIIDCPHSTPKWLNQGIPVIRNYNISNGQLDLSKLSYVDEETYESRIKRAKPMKNDIIISREAPMGEACLVPENFKCCLGQRLVLLKVDKEKCNPHYLLYALLSPYVQAQIKRIDQTGSIVSNLNIADLKKLIIPYIKENQNNIAQCLEVLNNKIHNNNKINEELESIAKTIYDYWFLQFEFPNEDGKPYKSSGGKMVWNEELKREIPEGWECIQLGKLFSFIKGKIPERLSDTQEEGLYPYITIDVANNAKAQYCSGENMIYCNGEVIMVMDGAASGDVYIGNKGILGSTFSMLKRKKTDISNALIYLILKSQSVIYKKVNTGSTIPHTNRRFIENIKIPISKNTIDFSKVLDETYEKIIQNRRENQELISLRDFLLPLLMNGQVSFKD